MSPWRIPQLLYRSYTHEPFAFPTAMLRLYLGSLTSTGTCPGEDHLNIALGFMMDSTACLVLVPQDALGNMGSEINTFGKCCILSPSLEVSRDTAAC